MKIKMSKLLYPVNANPKYTEEYAYNNSGEYPVIDGSTQNFEYKLKINTYDYNDVVIAITTVGYYAGHVSVYSGKFSVGNNVSCFTLSDYANRLKLNVNYLAFKIFQITKNIISGESGGYAALNINKFLDEYINIGVSEQLQIIKLMEKRNELFLLENKIDTAIQNFEKYNLSELDSNIVYTGQINKILDLIGGLSNLTQEYIYNNSDHLDTLLPVYTGSTTFSGQFVNKNKSKKIFKNQLKIARKGVAGHISYIQGEFTINDDAYVIKINDDYVEKINIHFLHFYLRSIINDAVSSQGGNGTFNKTKFLTFKIKLPSIDTQNEVGNIFYKYLKLIEVNEKIHDFRILLNKELYNLTL